MQCRELLYSCNGKALAEKWFWCIRIGFREQFNRDGPIIIEARQRTYPLLKKSSFLHDLYCESVSQKIRHQTLVNISSNIDRFSKFFYCYSHQEFCNKTIITDPIAPKTCRYTTLRNISFQKLHRLKAQQRQTRRAPAEENVALVGELVLSQ